MHLMVYDDDTNWSCPIWWTLWITLISWHVLIKFSWGFVSYYLFILWNAILTFLQVIVLSFNKQSNYKILKLGHILWSWQFCKLFSCHFVSNLLFQFCEMLHCLTFLYKSFFRHIVPLHNHGILLLIDLLTHNIVGLNIIASDYCFM
jgi:hypothetical protein